MTTTQRNNISNAAVGLLVFDIDTDSFWFKDSNGWVQLVSGNVSTLAHKGVRAILFCSHVNRFQSEELLFGELLE